MKISSVKEFVTEIRTPRGAFGHNGGTAFNLGHLASIKMQPFDASDPQIIFRHLGAALKSIFILNHKCIF